MWLAGDTSLDQKVVTQTINQLDKLFEDVDEAVYGDQLDANYQEAILANFFLFSKALCLRLILLSELLE